MKDQNEKLILQKIKECESEIRKYGVLKVGLFGSFAREEQGKYSDIDLLVEFDKEKKTFRNLMGFSQYMESVLGRKVEVVTPESMSPYIAPRIMHEVKYVQV